MHHGQVKFIPLCKNGSIYKNPVDVIHLMRDRNHTIISRDAEKAFDKIQHTFMIKTIKKLCVEGTYINTINATYEKSRAKIRLNGEKLKSFPLRPRTRQGCLFLLFLSSIVLK